jgi:hypothetical protein
MWDQSIEKLIEEVEKQPALYLKLLKEYSDTNHKKKFWEEECTALKIGMAWLLKRNN